MPSFVVSLIQLALQSLARTVNTFEYSNLSHILYQAKQKQLEYNDYFATCIPT